MSQALSDILTFFANAFFGSLIIGAICPLLGSFFVLRRMAFLGVAVPQFSAAGMSLGFLFLGSWLGISGHGHTGHHSDSADLSEDFTYFLAAALVFTFATLLILVWLNHRDRGASEGRIAVAYATAGALTILCLANSSLGQSHLNVLLRGEILTIGNKELLAIAAAYGAVLLLLMLFRREFLLVAYDEEAAISLGLRPLIWDAIFYVIAGAAISVGVMTVGPLVIFGFLLVPPMAALPLARNMTMFYGLASLFGVLAAFFGFVSSYMMDWPLGPTDVFVAFILLLVARLGSMGWRWLVTLGNRRNSLP